ncbi:MAG: phosphoribosylamine--glycine ligase [Pseudomonadota bacterium]
MKILVIGSGGREHALVWKLAQSPQVKKIYCAPGNAGIASIAECVPVSPSDLAALKNFALKNHIDLTVVGPELSLTLGIADIFEKDGLRVFGPAQQGAQLEGSKIFAKNIMRDAGILTADFAVFSDPDKAKKYAADKKPPFVIKADGLAAGKGVFPCMTKNDALDALERIMLNNEFGAAGSSVVIEDFLPGEEASFICFTDGKTILPLPSSQDHKRIFDEDTGPNTGGMGAYSPAPVITPEVHETVMQKIMRPLVTTLSSRGIRYKGIIYAGLMIENNIPRVLEFNARFGDPETQPILFRLESDLAEIMNAAIDGRLSEAVIKCDARPSVCVVMASGGYPDTYEKGHLISGLDTAEYVPDTFVFHSGTSLHNGHIVTSGGRVLGVTSRGTTIETALAAAYEAVGKIRWKDVHFRKDIARRALGR